MRTPCRRGACAAAALAAILAGPRAASADATPPPVPAGLRVYAAGPRSVTMEWDPVADAGGSGLKEYVLCRDGVEAVRLPGTRTTDTWALLPSTPYGYSVSAVDNAGNASARSAEVVAATLALPPIKNPLRVKVLLFNFPDWPGEPFDVAASDAVVFSGPDSVGAYMQEASYGRMSVSGAPSHGWYRMPSPMTSYCTFFYGGMGYGYDPYAIRQDALSVVPADVRAIPADVEVLVFYGIGTAGLGGGGVVWLSATNGFRLSPLLHEIGHNFNGVMHAGTWNLPAGQQAGPDVTNPMSGANVSRYGDPYDPMGWGIGHYDAFYKEMAGMFLPQNVATADRDGEYVLDALEVPSSGVQELRVPIQGKTFYFLEYRKPIGFDARSPGEGFTPGDGVLVRLRPDRWYGADDETLLPAPAGTWGTVVNPGAPFWDSYRQIRVEVVSKSGNQARVRITQPSWPSMADLAVTGVGGPASASPGQSIAVADTVQNAGGAPAGPFPVGLYLSTDAIITAADTPLGTRSVPGLAAGASSSGSTAVTIPAATAAGTYYLGAMADGTGAVAESNESNNALASTASISISAPPPPALPDLVVSAVSGPSSAPPGSSLSVSTTVQNPGGAAAGGFVVGIYLSPDPAITSADTFLGSRVAPGLAAGASSSASTSVTIPAGTAAGTYFLGAIADAAVEVAEADEENNAGASSSAISIAVPPPPPPQGVDLVVSSLSATVSGRSVSVSDSVKNQGSLSTASTFYVRYYLSLDGAITTSDAYLGSRAVGGLAAGAISTGSVSFTASTSLAPGAYYVGAITDATGLVAETDESNNARASSSAYPFRPDLSFSSWSASISSGQISISNTFKNQGNAATSGAFSGSFSLSPDSLPGADILLGSRSRTTALNVGSTDGATTKFSVAPATPPGDYFVIGVADSGGTQVELNEGNNVSVSAPRLSIRPDLYGSSLSASRSGTTLSVSDTVRNQGPLATSGSFRLDFYLSPDTTITTADTFLGSRTVPSSLGYGASNSATSSFPIPPALVPGSYRVGVIVDGGGSIPETVETNNAKYSSSLSLLPDLVAVSVTASASGRTVTVTEAVRNDGPVSAPAFQVDIRLSTDATIGGTDTLLGQRSVAALAPGASSTATTSLAVPATVPAGSYYPGVWADGPGVVAESSESNNRTASSGSMTVGP